MSFRELESHVAHLQHAASNKWHRPDGYADFLNKPYGGYEESQPPTEGSKPQASGATGIPDPLGWDASADHNGGPRAVPTDQVWDGTCGSDNPAPVACTPSTGEPQGRSVLGWAYGPVKLGQSVASWSLEHPRVATAMTAITVTGLIVAWHILQERFRVKPRCKSLLLQWLMTWTEQPKGNPGVRSSFNSVPMVGMRESGTHTHPTSALMRSQATLFIETLAMSLGVKPFFYQMSASDQRNARNGSRDPFWSKDLNAEMRDDDPSAGFIALVDVDYYVDMEEKLSRATGPVVLYTLVPERVARDNGEYSYTFTKDNEITYTVAGGGAYRHQLWDYGTDTLIVERRSMLGLIVTSTTFNVDRRQIDSDHQAICLTPIASLRSPFVGLSWFVDGTRLKRLEVVQTLAVGKATQSFLRLDSQGREGRQRSTGIPGAFVEITIPASVDDTLAVQSRIGKTDLTVAQVKTTTGSDSPATSVLAAYHRAKSTHAAPVVFPITNAFQSFDFSPDNCDPESKDSSSAFMSPLVDGAFVPKISKGNDTQSIKGRVEGVRPNVGPIPAKYLGYMQEFVEKLIPNPGQGHPVDHDEVFERQSRPTQRSILDDACATGGVDKCGEVTNFMKKESYGKVTDPRNITIIPPRNKYKYSTFIYAFSEVLRATEWYAFGKTPLEIAERVAEICSEASSVTGTDLSRCDGRISNWFRHFERMLMHRFFHGSYNTALTEIMITQFGQRGKTATGYKFSTGDSRLSGSSETADFNSVDNALMAYVTYREMGLSPEQAYSKLGLYGGDDGLSSDADSAVYTRVCANFGQVLEAEVLQRHAPGVNFLARFFGPDVWTGDMNSMCDIKRQMLKFHITSNFPRTVTATQKLIEKSRGYLATDRNTPIIGEFCRAVERAYGKGKALAASEGDSLRSIGNWFSKYSEDVQFPNVDNDWMDSYVASQFEEFDLEQFRDWLKNAAADPQALLSPPVCAFSRKMGKVPADVVVDDDIVRAQTVECKEEEEERKYPENRTPCKFYAAGTCSYGEKCANAHVGNVVQAKIECNKFKTTGQCKYGVKCIYAHVPGQPPKGAAKRGAPSKRTV